MNVDEPRAMDALQQCFSSTGAERALQARRQFFEAGIRPSGLVSEAVPRAELGETARALAQRIAALPRQALAAMRNAKTANPIYHTFACC